MEEYAKILNYAVPAFFVLIMIEYGASCFVHLKVNRIFDTISSLSSGLTNVIKDVLGLSVVVISYGWLVDHMTVVSLTSTIWVYILTWIGLDFSGYWIHRWSHEFNLFWNRHIIHHSSEEFNLSCALRQSVSEIFAIFTFTLIPLALLGVSPGVIAVVAPLHLFAQFWYHTRLIGRMGVLEHIIVTPSHHRVHHAINSEYMDKNYGQIFIIWDKLFGTFQEEIAEIPPVYGVTRAVKTWNPWLINYQHLWLLIKDAWRARSWWDKCRIWWMPTGWRPDDVQRKYPVPYISDVYHREKYETESSLSFKIWSGTQFLITLLLMMYFFNRIGDIAPFYIFSYGFFLFVSIFAYTSLMDGSILGVAAEVIKVLIGLGMMMSMEWSWFGMEDMWTFGNQLMVLYLLVSLGMTLYFYVIDRPKEVSLIEVHQVDAVRI
ncbi:MAG: sterol desaturase family protein [Saprospiraceae bacterium]